MGKSVSKKKHSGYHLRIEQEWFESPAYRDLSPTARCLLLEFINLYRPGRNGDLSISIRQAADRLNTSNNTSAKYFSELVEHGFLSLNEHENWHEKSARTFELTVRGMGTREPRHLWRQWRPGLPVDQLPKRKKTVLKN
jgi:hypothetical protein